MFIPIAALYNERGVFVGMRFFQWFGVKDRVVDLVEDYLQIAAVPIMPPFTFKQTKVINLSLADLRKLKSKRQLVGKGFIRVLNSITGFESISKVRRDGFIETDSVALVCYGRKDSNSEYSFVVVDSYGKYGIYSLSYLSKAYSRSLRIANWAIWQSRSTEGLDFNDINTAVNMINPPHEFTSLSLRVHISNWLGMATKAFTDKLNKLITEYTVLGLPTQFNSTIGQIVCGVGSHKEVIVPEGIDIVRIEEADDIQTLSLPKDCSLSCETSTLTKLYSPEVATVFALDTSVGLKELTLPKVMHPRAELQSNFLFDTMDLPLYLTDIDQSNYSLDTNIIHVRGSNNLQRLILAASAEPNGVCSFRLDNAQCLQNMDIIRTSSNEEDISIDKAGDVSIHLGHLGNHWTTIHCKTCCNSLKLEITEVTSGFLLIKYTGEGRLSVIFHVSYRDWMTAAGEQLVVLYEGNIDFAYGNNDNSGDKMSDVAFIKTKTVYSEGDEERYIKEFLNGNYGGNLLIVSE